jgi:MbtH protein
MSESKAHKPDLFRVVVNEEDQYSIWWSDRDLPNGWKEAGFEGSKEECIAHVDRTWTDMRPRSLRLRMDSCVEAASEPEIDGIR